MSGKFAGLAAVNNRGTKRIKPNRPMGRPKTGRRSNPDYGQVSYYIKNETKHLVVRRLHERNAGKRSAESISFGDLVQELLEAWLAKPRLQ